MGDSSNKSPKTQEPKYEEPVFSIHVLEVNLFRRITRNYARHLRVLPTAHLLPQRRPSYLPVNEVGDCVEVQTLEDQVDLVVYDIDEPFRQIIPS